MSSGGADGAYITSVTKSLASDNTNFDWPSYTTWYSPVTVYYYQIRCGKRSCKALNWLQIDVIQPCTKCGAKLKAVMDEPDYTIPVER